MQYIGEGCSVSDEMGLQLYCAENQMHIFDSDNLTLDLGATREQDADRRSHENVSAASVANLDVRRTLRTFRTMPHRTTEMPGDIPPNSCFRMHCLSH